MSPRRSALMAAFFAIYVIWGSTYLGIRVALESMPPFALAAGRFLLAGLAMGAWALRERAERPSAQQFANTVLLGFLFLVAGNGLVVWAEVHVPSGLAALLAGVTPIWTSLLLWLVPGGRAPTAGMLLGLVSGFVGAALLVAPGELGGAPVHVGGAIALVLASLAWAAGSVASPRLDLPRSRPMSAALQMLNAGVMLAVIAVLTGDVARFDAGAVTTRSLVAFLYLVVFGSLVAFSAFAWLLQVSTPERTSTTAYVNPIVAVLLGWLFAGEPIT
ncbi:MAG TPA: EamA family transporter, partial [Gemmatimonadales bacterium]|nr:EamA family transporter [Gemmatimonadales bacterium]